MSRDNYEEKKEREEKEPEKQKPKVPRSLKELKAMIVENNKNEQIVYDSRDPEYDYADFSSVNETDYADFSSVNETLIKSWLAKQDFNFSKKEFWNKFRSYNLGNDSEFVDVGLDLRLVMAKHWLRTKNPALTSEEFKDLVSHRNEDGTMTATPFCQSYAVKAWLQNPNLKISLSELASSMLLIKQLSLGAHGFIPDSEQEMVKDFLSTTTTPPSLAEFQALIERSKKSPKPDFYLTLNTVPLVSAFLSNENIAPISIPDLKTVLEMAADSVAGDHANVPTILKQWLMNPKTPALSIEEFTALCGEIPILQSNRNAKISFQNAWIEKQNLNIDLEDLKKNFLNKIENNPDLTYSIVEAWSRGDGIKEISITDLESLLSEAKIGGSNKAVAVKSWVEGQKLNIPISDLKTALKMVDDGIMVPTILNKWLSNPQTPALSIKEFTALCGEIPILNSDRNRNAKIHFQNSWIEKQNLNIDLEDLKKNFLNKIENNPDLTYSIVEAWSRGDGIKKISVKELESLLLQAGIMGSGKTVVVESWVEGQNNISVSDLKTALQMLDDAVIVPTILKAWLSNPQTPALSIEEFTALCGEIPILQSNRNAKISFQNAWIEKQELNIDLKDLKTNFLNKSKDLDLKFQIAQAWLEKGKDFSIEVLADLIKSTYSAYNAGDIYSLYVASKLEVEKLPEFCLLLHPNLELMQVEIVETFILKADRNAVLNNDFNSKKIETAKRFISNIKDDDLVIDVVTKYQKYNSYSITDPVILTLLQGRLSSQYESIDLLLKKRPIIENLKPEELTKIQELFTGVDLTKFNLADLLSYLVVKQPAVNFKDLLTDKVAGEIKESFQSSSKIAFFKPVEYKYVKGFIGHEAEFPKIEILCEYFKDLAPKVEINKETYQIKFPEESEISKERQTGLNGIFKELVGFKETAESKDASKPPESRDAKIIGFFRGIFAMDEISDAEFEEVINSRNKTKLVEFFNKNQIKLATLLSREGGIKDLLFNIPSLRDGCSANIGSQINLALYASLLKDKDKEDLVFYRIFEQKIVVPILNQGGDLIASDVDPLENSKLREHLVSPKGLLHLITKNIQASEFTEVLQRLPVPRENLAMLMGGDATNLVTHAILQKIPTIFNHPDLKKFRETCEATLKELQTPEIEEKGPDFVFAVPQLLMFQFDEKDNIIGLQSATEKTPSPKPRNSVVNPSKPQTPIQR